MRPIIISLIFILSLSEVNGQSFIKEYGTASDSLNFNLVIECADSNYFFAGQLGTSKLLIMKTDQLGDTLWDIVDSISPAIKNIYSAIDIKNSGSLVGIGDIYTTIWQGFLIKISPDGNTEMIKSYLISGGNYCSFWTILPFEDSLLISALWNDSLNNPHSGLLVTDTLGNIGKVIEYSNIYDPLFFSQSLRNGFIFMSNKILIRLDSTLNILWSAGLSNGLPVSEFSLSNIYELPDSTFIGVLRHYGHLTQAEDDEIFKLDKTGNFLWAVRDDVASTSTYINFLALQSLANGNILFSAENHILIIDSTGTPITVRYFQNLSSGFHHTIATGKRDIVLASGNKIAKCDTTGNICGSVDVSFNQFPPLTNIVSKSITDSIYLPNITINTIPFYQSRGIISVTSCNSLSVDDIDLPQIVSIYPNPVHNNLHIDFPDNNSRLISITDMSGKLIYKKKSLDSFSEIDLSFLSAGIYVVNIQSENSNDFRKIVKQ